jgi:hypothetical protein
MMVMNMAQLGIRLVMWSYCGKNDDIANLTWRSFGKTNHLAIEPN